jgi:hypothetical protein
MRDGQAAFGTFWSELSDAEQEAIQADVDLILDSPSDAEEASCANEAEVLVLVRSRIGGPVNLKSYAASLLAGIARRDQVQS